MRNLLLGAAILFGLALGAEAQQVVILEAEAFQDRGGWEIDAQFMDQMGSPFLLAHGLGHPVKDAVTAVKLPVAGKYRLLVRTRDWVAPWKAPGAPGKFQVLIDGKAVPTTFGTQGADWHWQDGGFIEAAKSEVVVTLHDLTGFEGRCDAIAFVPEGAPVPPQGGPELDSFRRKAQGLPDNPEEAGQFDLVVVGGGIAGTCAAISAARLGLSVAMVQDRPVLGGNNSSEVRVWLQGARNLKPYPRVGDIVAELEQKKHAHYGPTNTAEIYEDEKKLNVARGEKTLKLFLNHRANGIQQEGKRITAVLATDVLTGRRWRFAGRWFADCTGDGCVGFLAGADFEMEPKGRMGSCNLWNVLDTGQGVEFPRCPWALDLSDKPFPGRSKDKPDPLKLGGWYWESGFDIDPFEKAEYIRDWNFRAMYGAWDALKNVDKVLPTYKLNWCAYVSGKRESRRLMGDIVISKKDLVDGTDFPDGFAPTGWKIDLHLPEKKYEKGFEGDAFISSATFGPYKLPFWIPYRALYSRNVPNLFMAGRNASVTHEALGAVRVMRTGGTMGEVVGMAASVCKKHNVDPRAVYADHFEEFKQLILKGVGKIEGTENPGLGKVIGSTPAGGTGGGGSLAKLQPPKWYTPDLPNLARQAKVTVSGSKDLQKSPPALLNDGKLDLTDADGRWLSEAKVPHTIEFAWEQAQTISAVRIVSGYPQGGTIVAPVNGLKLEQEIDGAWKGIPGTILENNTRFDLDVRFAPVQSKRLRVVITDAKGDISRIWEIEFYNPKPE